MVNHTSVDEYYTCPYGVNKYDDCCVMVDSEEDFDGYSANVLFTVCKVILGLRQLMAIKYLVAYVAPGILPLSYAQTCLYQHLAGK